MVGSLERTLFFLAALIVTLAWAQLPNVPFSATAGGQGSNKKDIQVNVVINQAHLSEDDELHLNLDFVEQWRDTQSRKSCKLEVLNADEMRVLKIRNASLSNGMFGRMSRLELTLSCETNFFYFPFDKQICFVKIVNDCPDTVFQINANDSAYPVKIRTASHSSEIFTFARNKINTFNVQEDFGQFNESGIELGLLFTRERERAFPMFYFPVIALMLILFKSMFLPNKLHSIFISLSVFLAMLLWIGIFQSELPRSGSMGMLDHYHFLCLNLALNAVTVSIIMHMFLQNKDTNDSKVKKSISESDHSIGFTDIKLEISSVGHENGKANNGTSSKISENDNDSTHEEDDPEAHIYKMGKFKQFIYFKACKPARIQLPIGFLVINLIYWTWILVSSLIYPSGFVKNLA